MATAGTNIIAVVIWWSSLYNRYNRPGWDFKCERTKGRRGADQWSPSGVSLLETCMNGVM
eukprot:6894351-Karenia_brevis.AAC.1